MSKFFLFLSTNVWWHANDIYMYTCVHANFGGRNVAEPLATCKTVCVQNWFYKKGMVFAWKCKVWHFFWKNICSKWIACFMDTQTHLYDPKIWEEIRRENSGKTINLQTMQFWAWNVAFFYQNKMRVVFFFSNICAQYHSTFSVFMQISFGACNSGAEKPTCVCTIRQLVIAKMHVPGQKKSQIYRGKFFCFKSLK